MSESATPSAAIDPAPTGPVRVRFCPSPTGTPHVGLARTALFNWAYARHTGGKLVLRIEDTDAARDSEESYQQILEAMEWLGFDVDEGPAQGGPHAPYRQSQRKEQHLDVAQRLLAEGYAYESYSTGEEIEARHKAAGRDPKLGYDGYDRTLTPEEIASFKAAGREPVIRLRMPDTDITFTDLIRGDVTFKAGTVPDFVIVRAGGQPLYTLVNPVDDAMMGITHVFRGEDILSSTPRQIALYRALIAIGVAQHVPVYAHMPLVLGEGNKKLSKRDPRSNLFLYREQGFVREGMVNYLALLGWAIGPDRDVFSPQELVEAFDIADVNPNPARWDDKKALAINADHIRMLSETELAARLLPYLVDAGVLSANPTLGEMGRLQELIPLIQTRIQTLVEGVHLIAPFYAADDAIAVAEDAAKQLKENAGEVVTRAAEALESIDDHEGDMTGQGATWTTAAIEEALREALVDDMGLKPRLAFGPVRTAISGQRISPPLFESLEILGKTSSLARLRAFSAAHGG